MNNSNDNIDHALRLEFIDEALTGLELVSNLFVELETHPDQKETIQSIFRPIHSIKGNAAYFGLLKTKHLAHELETILDLLRKGALAPSQQVISTLLDGCDELRAMLSRAQQNQEETDTKSKLDDLVLKVRGLSEKSKLTEEELWKELFTEIKRSENKTLLNPALSLAQSSIAGRKALSLFNQNAENSSVIPEQAILLLNLLSDETTTPNVEELKDIVQHCPQCTSSEPIKILVDKLLSTIELLNNSIGLGDPISRSTLNDQIHEIINAGGWKTPPTTSERSSQVKSKNVSKESTQTTSGKVMRIPEESVDKFLAHIGELVTIGEMYSHFQSNLIHQADNTQAAVELRRINEAYDNTAHALQQSILQIRKVPMNTILQRAPRTVRDIATAKGKEIETVIMGGDLLVDKSLVDTLESPLMHMVRNAADHGIEMPEKRSATNKSSKGTITIKVEETSDSICLSIRDDGKGLDREALAKKALELGLIKDNQSLTDNDIISLLFVSGVSTAQEVTDVSGRGVGMDVVKRAIDDMGGHISVHSTPGQGAEFIVQLPKTVSTQIFEGYIIALNDNRYVFPLKDVLRCLPVSETKIVDVAGKGECVNIDNQLLTVHRLEHIFNDHPKSRQSDAIIVVIETKQKRIAVEVDRVEGVRQVVLKNINGILDLESGLFSGGAIMGDGQVAMIINTDYILKRFIFDSSIS